MAVQKSVQITFFALGTVNTITAFGVDDPAPLLPAKARVLELNDRLSAFQPDSEVSRINRAAGAGFVPVHADTFELIRAAVRYSALSEGAFDLTVRPVVSLWGIGKKGPYVPSEKELAQVRPLVDYRSVVFDEADRSVMLRASSQAIDLGGIAKGYAADEVRRLLALHGVSQAVVNLGGTVAVMGACRTVGVQHPRKATGVPMGILPLCNQAAVTSGSYEKFFVKDGVRYHHILDPRTGRPARSGLMGVTLIGRSAMELDALTTAVFVLGPADGMDLVRQLDLQAVFITDDLDVFITPELKDSFSLITK